MRTTIHAGHNIKRIREILGIKQEALAVELGEDWSQKKISLLEQKEEIDEPLLEQVAKAMKVPVEAIKNFSEEAAVNVIATTITNNDHASTVAYFPVYNPVDKWMEALEENKKLYERLLQAEREKVAILEEVLKKK